MFKKLTDGFQSTLAQAGEQAKARNALTTGASPRPSSSQERPAPIEIVSEDGILAETQLESDNEDEDEKAESQLEKTTNSVAESSLTSSSDLDADLQKRLNKLAKYEKKYPELLKAYRILQAQDADVKTFERVLREITPATSVADVEAFQQWAQNFSLKAEMSMEELRRITKVLETLQRETLQSAEQHATQLSQARQRIAELENIQEQHVTSVEETERIKVLERQLVDKETKHDDHITLLKNENKELSEALTAAQVELSDTRQSLEDSRIQLTLSEQRNASLTRETNEEVIALQSSRDTLRQEIIHLKISHAQELWNRTASSTATPIHATNFTATKEVEHTESLDGGSESTPLSKGQRKRKNKKKLSSAKAFEEEVPDVTKDTQTLSAQELPAFETTQNSLYQLQREKDGFRLELETLRAHAEAFDDQKSNYERKIKKLEEHQESIEDLRDMLKDIGDKLVTTKDHNKALMREKIDLEKELGIVATSLEGQTESLAALEEKLSHASETAQGATTIDEYKRTTEELREKSMALEEKLGILSKDLDIAQILSSERFKELATTKEALKVKHAEANDIRNQLQASQLEYANLEKTAKSTEARVKSLERSERDNKDELEKHQKQLISRERELKVIQTAFNEEEIRRKSEETRAAALKVEAGKMATLRDSILASRSELMTQISTMKSELDVTKTKLADLQQIRNKLIQERNAAQEELELGKAKFDSSFTLMESQREQTIDMQHRLRETLERFEALEEELSESRRQLAERNGEAETLRRLLSDIEGSQESRLREMRERMESAIAERDKAEDEAAFNGKKRAREVEDLKEKLLDNERAQRKLVAEKQDSIHAAADLRNTLDRVRKESEENQQDTRTLRATMTELSRSLKEAEAQISSLETDRDSLRSALKDAISKLDRQAKEMTSQEHILNKFRNEKAHMTDRRDAAHSPVHTRASAHQSVEAPSSAPASPIFLRSPSMQSVSLNDRPIEKAEVDREYIKNVLFQFFEHKDKRKYLLPAITKLLLLSKQQEGVFVNSLR